MNFKYILIILLFISSVFNSFAVQVTQSTPSATPATDSGSGILGVIFFFIIFGAIAVGFIMWIIITIQKKIEEYNKRKRDYIYHDFENNLAQCHINRDPSIKYKNWKRFWLMFKRNPVYIRTAHGLRAVGMYEGECSKKENFYFIALYNKLGWFKYVNSIIFIPISLKDSIVMKLGNGKDSYIVIDCEGLDNIGDMDYYCIPLIPDAKNPKEFLDFTDMIHTKYIEKIVYKNIIKENLQQYREGIIKSVETNPNVQFSRRLEK